MNAPIDKSKKPWRPDSPVLFRAISADRKLSPVDLLENTTSRPRPTPRPPYVCSTYVSIEATCPDSCVFKKAGCYVRGGFTGKMQSRLDDVAARLVPQTRGVVVATLEAHAIDQSFQGHGHNRKRRELGRVPQDGARGGRDLRLHVGGDTANARAAAILAGAATRWKARGGGAVWTYTARHATIPRKAFGPDISVLASVQSLDDAARAWELGYAPALTTADIGTERGFEVLGGAFKVVPCPAETRQGVTCASCRLCMDDKKLHDLSIIIGFRLHGTQAGKVRHKLHVLQPVQLPLEEAP